MAFTIVTANKILDKILRNTDFSPPTTVYVSLHTGDPGQTGANEVTGGSYVRDAVTFTVGASKASSNSTLIEYTAMPGCVVTYVGLWDAAAAGNFWWGGALSASKTVNAGDTFQIPIGDLDVVLT